MEDIHNWQSKFESCEYAERSLLKRRRSLHVNVRFKKSMWMFKWYMNIMFIFDSLLPRIQCPFSHILL
jgi:hypothetical protein